MTDRLLALRIFVRTAHSGSFSRAGRDLGLSQPSISRILAQLEAEVGARLLVRTTRAVTLTEAGADYLARVEPLLAALEEADHVARGTGELRGLVRVAVSSSFGVREVIPRLPKFLELHPALRIDLGINDQRQDLIVDGVDVALRLGSLPDSSVVARKLSEAPRVLAASPAYLARRGRPRNPEDLASHAVIIGPGGASGPNAWTFRKSGQTRSVRVEGQLTTAVNEAAVAGAVAGLGITLTSLWGCRAEIERGDLTRIMEDWTMAPVEAHALFPSGRAASPAARAFIDYLAAEL
ncbi:DNA-binding transcriptional LysR family regulator [Roseiarcus fermentans]|uniref:DNA-binding transcriptional LysR family regulator n=1 Tax=Roseiarcus fermentans TaxID=1473586 RepID=A0A366FKS8_9HYPH|nr:LysR family transcriptional regulator [Roseiarcus fermentans]RBP14325.1 DNA-binding transcriptional LysR family regulator [Roseiarcus fermentans]